MLTGVFQKTIRDRWLGWAIAVGTLGLLLWMVMWAYQNIDVSIYDTLPEVYRSIIGMSGEADVGSLAINALTSSYGALTLAAMALAMGGAAVAGEERAGTFGLLLGNPKSRTDVLVSKAAAMVVLTALGVFALTGITVLTARLLGVSIVGMQVWALGVHLFASTLFYGFLALAVGSWTGNRGAAVGVPVGLMVVSFFAVGVLPIIDGGEDYVKFFPWHYFTGSDPLLNGVDWGDVAVLGGGAAVLAAASWFGLARRDLKAQSVGVTLLDRLRANPLTDKFIGRLAGSARVSGIWIKTASEYQAHLVLTAVLMFGMMGVLMGPMYAAIPDETLTAFASFPEEMMVLFGGGDIVTPEGWYQIETFGMMAPIAVMVVAIAIGAGALAGEEARRTMGLLLANPIKRSRIVIAKTWTMVLYSVLIGVATWAGVTLGSVLGGLGMDMGNIAAACLLQTLVGLVFGALALALSAGTGNKMVAIFGAIGLGVVTHVLDSMGELNDALASVARLSPFYYYLQNDPLNEGLLWSDAIVLVAITVVLIGVSLVLFERRDVRQR